MSSEPRIRVLEKDRARIQVLLQGVPRVYCNALRRFALSEVPVMAIHEVVILENTSIMYDEVLSHRLGLIPLTTPVGKYNLPEECSCRSETGCPNCRVMLALDAEAKEGPRTVMSGELVSEDREVRPVSPDIPIVPLATGQKVKLEAYACLGKGSRHAKWQAATISTLVPRGEEEFVLTIESAGSLPAEEILKQALQILKKQLQQLEASLK
jgi:DNA-directed RNA polymerase subunit D